MPLQLENVPRYCGIQFDDSEEGSGKKTLAGTARDEALFEPRPPPREADSRSSSSPEDKWQEQWFAHEDKRMDKLGLEVRRYRCRVVRARWLASTAQVTGCSGKGLSGVIIGA